MSARHLESKNAPYGRGGVPDFPGEREHQARRRAQLARDEHDVPNLARSPLELPRGRVGRRAHALYLAA